MLPIRPISPFNRPLHTLSLSLGLVILVSGCTQTPETVSPSTTTDIPSDELSILWDKGYVIEEDEAIETAVNQWQAETSETVDLAFYNSGEIAPKTLRASQAGAPPDILFAAKSVYPISDWQGKLADVTDVVEPKANTITADALQAAKVYGSEVAGDRYYAVPLNQSTIQIHYWKDLLAEAGYTPDDIPTEWDDFWTFWKTAQDTLQAQGEDIYGMGLPLSENAKDSHDLFEQVLVAYNVSLLDEKGQLQIDQPDVREGIIQCLTWYTQWYDQGYVPPNASQWLDPDNNRNFLNRQVLMTPNPTLSIPAAVRNDEETYFNKMGTLPWPNRPDGSPLPHLVETRQAIIFVDAVHPDLAKQFLSYLIQPEIISAFLKTSYGRFMPVTDAIKTDPFWSDPVDPHISTVTNIVLNEDTQPFNLALNPAYGVVMEENVWGQALNKIVEEGVSVEVAADQAIEQIQQIFAAWS